MQRNATLALIAGLLAGAISPCAAQETAEGGGTAALIEALEMPKVGSLTVSVGFKYSFGADAVRAADAPAVAEAIQEKVAAGEATAEQMARLGDALELMDQETEAQAARTEAERLFRERVEADGSDVAALVGLADLVRREDRDQALAFLQRAAQAEPDNPFVQAQMVETLVAETFAPYGIVALAFLLNQSGLPAEEVASQLRDYLPLDFKMEEYLEEDPRPDLDAAEAAMERVSGRIEAAQAKLAAAARQDPSVATLAALGMAESLVALSEASLSLGRLLVAGGDLGTSVKEVAGWFGKLIAPEEVVAAGREACRARPEDAKLRAYVGMIQAARLVGDLFAAMVQAEGDVLAVPKAPEADLKEAVVNLEAGLKLPEGERGGVGGALAMLYMLAGQPDACRDLAEVRLDPGEWDYSVLSAYVLSSLGLTLNDAIGGIDFTKVPQERIEEAARRVKAWVDTVEPTAPEAYGALAGLYRHAGDYASATPALEKARELAPDSALFACALGVARLKIGQFADAHGVLVQAVALEPQDPELARKCHHALGVALAALGRMEDARDELTWEPRG